MDLLCKAYSVSNLPTMNPNPNPTLNPYTVTSHHLPFHHSKCPKPEYPFPTLELPKRDEAPLLGRYISKRKRTLSGTVHQANEPNPNHRDPHNQRNLPLFVSCLGELLFSSLGSISESDLPRDVLSSMWRKPKGHTHLSQIPEKINAALHGHAKAVNAVHWSPTPGMDQTINIWNVWSRDQKKARRLSFHNAAVKDVKWSQRGLFVLSCGYDCSSRLIDVEKGLESKMFRDDQVYAEAYTCPCVSLDGEKLASGSSDGSIYFYNSRSPVLIKKIKAYEEACVDVAFHPILSNVIASCNWNGDVSLFD
ncbi:hypothetical protein GQ457_13G002830 [Hibiscus cannabinus]